MSTRMRLLHKSLLFRSSDTALLQSSGCILLAAVRVGVGVVLRSQPGPSRSPASIAWWSLRTDKTTNMVFNASSFSSTVIMLVLSVIIRLWMHSLFWPSSRHHNERECHEVSRVFREVTEWFWRCFDAKSRCLYPALYHQCLRFQSRFHQGLSPFRNRPPNSIGHWSDTRRKKSFTEMRRLCFVQRGVWLLFCGAPELRTPDISRKPRLIMDRKKSHLFVLGVFLKSELFYILLSLQRPSC